jgi:hypothetical protein
VEFTGEPVSGIKPSDIGRPIRPYWRADGFEELTFLDLARARVFRDGIAAYIEATWPEPEWEMQLTIYSLDRSCAPDAVAALWRGIQLLDWELCASPGGRPKGSGPRAEYSADEIRKKYAELAVEHQRQHLKPPNRRQLADALYMHPQTLRTRMGKEELDLPWPPD